MKKNKVIEEAKTLLIPEVPLRTQLTASRNESAQHPFLKRDNRGLQGDKCVLPLPDQVGLFWQDFAGSVM